MECLGVRVLKMPPAGQLSHSPSILEEEGRRFPRRSSPCAWFLTSNLVWGVFFFAFASLLSLPRVLPSPTAAVDCLIRSPLGSRSDSGEFPGRLIALRHWAFRALAVED